MSLTRTYRAGESLEDLCRACKADRLHTVIVVDADGAPIRVVCGYCHSEHNYRGGPASASSRQSTHRPAPDSAVRPRTGRRFPSSATARGHQPCLGVKHLRISKCCGGSSARRPASRWSCPPTSGAAARSCCVRAPGLQEKTWPIETFFHKVVMLRNRLRTLEQQVNASDLPDTVKVKLQSCVSGCYGSPPASTSSSRTRTTSSRGAAATNSPDPLSSRHTLGNWSVTALSAAATTG